jgi:DNA-binding protein H-NS
MATYKEIKRQIADLEKKAVEAKKVEVAEVIAGMKIQIVEYDLTPADLFKGIPSIGAKKTKSARKPAKPANPPKYMDPKTRKTWTGHGKPPSWIAAAINKGKKDDFLIAKVEELLAAKTLAKAPNATKLKTYVKPATVKPAVKASAIKKAPTPEAKKAATPKKLTAKAKAPTIKKTGSARKPASVEPTKPSPALEVLAAPIASETV